MRRPSNKALGQHQDVDRPVDTPVDDPDIAHPVVAALGAPGLHQLLHPPLCLPVAGAKEGCNRKKRTRGSASCVLLYFASLTPPDRQHPSQARATAIRWTKGYTRSSCSRSDMLMV
ncbi:hypothetical protein ACKKBF_B41010 [Auxenochlorella protothecoides x Auxenochlorella symbiontica]